MSEIQQEGNAIIVRPGQDIVSTMVPGFKQELADVLAREPREIRLDMAGVEMMDSIGIGLLIAIHNSMRKNGGKLVVLNSTDNISKLFRSMRLDQHFQMSE
ncbi:MAG: anti-sigma factor antagonist [Deltaproteobacteria bacterium]|nr:anti-sigma factor antagonist [Deltaproteobacteria bacterium]